MLCFLTNASAVEPPLADESLLALPPISLRGVRADGSMGRESMMEKERTCCDRPCIHAAGCRPAGRSTEHVPCFSSRVCSPLPRATANN